jgi:hypothetical protein
MEGIRPLKPPGAQLLSRSSFTLDAVVMNLLLSGDRSPQTERNVEIPHVCLLFSDAFLWAARHFLSRLAA